MNVVWTKPARDDVLAIETYLLKRNPSAAKRIISRIEAVVGLLKTSPGIGRPGRRRGTRELFVSGTTYVVVVRVGDRQADVLAVFHTRQDHRTRDDRVD